MLLAVALASSMRRASGAWMRFSLIPRSGHFYPLFEEMARKLVVASEGLADLLEHFENVDAKTAQLKVLEHEADNITHEIYREVHQTFVTPLDREDIAALAQRMDDVMDFIEGASTAIRIYGISQPTQASRGLADLIRLQCLQLEKAVSTLRHRHRLISILEQLKEVNRLENEADTLFLNSMADMFQGEMSSVDIIKWRDVYNQLERATDSCEQVAHILEAIVLKHA